MKIALAQINSTVGDFAGNIDRIVKFARRAQERGADLVVFPELALCGYPPRDLVERPGFIRKSEAELERLAGLLPPIATLVGYVRRSNAVQGKAAADAAALIKDGRVALDYTKILLPFYDVFDESRYFEPGQAIGLQAFNGFKMSGTTSISGRSNSTPEILSRRVFAPGPICCSILLLRRTVQRNSNCVMTCSRPSRIRATSRSSM